MPRSVRVRLYSTAREAVGSPEIRRDVPPEGLSVLALLEELRVEFPRLGPVLSGARFVRNGEFLPGRTGRLRPGDEFAIHPPYSGG